MGRAGLGAAVPALVGVLVTLATGIAMWASDAPWTFTLDSGSVFLGQTVPAFHAWFAGRVPEWSDMLWGGLPLIGDSTTAALYPPYALTYALTKNAPLRFFDVAFALHLGIFAAGSAALVRRLGATAGAAALGGVLAAMAPFAHYCAIAHFPVFGAHAWWPWTFVAVDMLAEPAARLVGAAMVLGWIALAMQVLVGVPEQMLYCAVPAVLWLLLRRSSLGIGQRVLRVAVLGAGAGALAAPQLLPTMLILPWSHRTGTPHQYQLGSLWLTRPVQLFVAGTGVINGFPTFLGLVTLVLAAVAVLARRRHAMFLLALAVIAFALALGPQVGLYEWLHRIPPFDHFRNPGKLHALAEFSTLWLAAVGADALWRRGTSRARLVAAVLAAGAIGEHLVYLPGEVAAFDALRRGDGLTPARYAALASLDKLRQPDRTRPPIVVYDAGGPIGGEYARSIGALLDISSIHAGSVALLSPAHIELLDRPSGAMLDLFGVRYALAPARKCSITSRKLGWSIVESRDDDCLLAGAAPRADRYILLDEVAPVATAADMVTAVRRQPRPTPVVAPPDVAAGPGRGVLTLTSYAPGRATLLSATRGPALVLARESFAPGWVARVDGRDVAAHPAAGIFFAVPVGAGVHTIELEYRAPGFRTGLLVALGWTIAALAVAMRARRRASHG